LFWFGNHRSYAFNIDTHVNLLKCRNLLLQCKKFYSHGIHWSLDVGTHYTKKKILIIVEIFWNVYSGLNYKLTGEFTFECWDWNQAFRCIQKKKSGFPLYPKKEIRLSFSILFIFPASSMAYVVYLIFLLWVNYVYGVNYSVVWLCPFHE
jgi:hypothetical protein